MHIGAWGIIVLNINVSMLPSLPPSPVPGKGKGKEKEKAAAEYKSTTVLFVVPYTVSVPSFSTVSAALGLGGVGERWLCGSDEQGSPVKPTADEANYVKLSSTIQPWKVVRVRVRLLLLLLCGRRKMKIENHRI